MLVTLLPASMIPDYDNALIDSIKDIPEPERTWGVVAGRLLAERSHDGFSVVVSRCVCARARKALRHRSGHLHLINLNVPADEQSRTYQSVGELSDEMIEARILAGIHFRTADRDGARLGRQVAQFALTHVLREADKR